MRRRLGYAAGTAIVALTAMSAAPAADGSISRVVVRHSQFGTWNNVYQPVAVTYNTKLVPAGADVTATESAVTGHTKVELRLHGLPANRQYGAAVHTARCGATGDAAGPRYQNKVNTASAPGNEVRMDFRTDAKGDAAAGSGVDWNFRADAANSIVIHDRATRVACLTMPF